MEFMLPVLGVQEDIANLQLPDPALMSYYKAAENRTFYVDSEIDSSLIEISKCIIEINRADRGIPIEDRKPIWIPVYSYGGELDAAYSFIAVMESSVTPVYTINMGVAMSAGLLILLGGQKRYCLKRSRALYHSGSATIGGTYEQIETNTDSYKEMVKDMRDYIMEKTNIDTKLFNKMKAKDWYISDEDQVKYGICHSIIDSLDMIL
jgi:ATP-dependent Clp protease protease subunit